MKNRTVFFCICAIILLFGIVSAYFNFRDNKFLGEQKEVNIVEEFGVSVD